MTNESHGVPVYSPDYAGTKLRCLVTEAMCVNNLAQVALDSAAAGTGLAISNCKSNTLTAMQPSHTQS